MIRKIITTALIALITLPVLAGETELRKFIHKGMTESEVIAKVDSPDSTSTVSGGGAEQVEQLWTNLPAGWDSQVVTTIRLKNAVVEEVTRTISR